MVSLFGVDLDIPDFGKAAKDAWDSVQDRIRQLTNWLNDWMASFASTLAGYIRDGLKIIPKTLTNGLMNAVKAGVNAFRGVSA